MLICTIRSRSLTSSVASRTISCFYSTISKPLESKPPLYDILPSKKPLSRILFDLDSKHSYGKLYPVYETIYKAICDPQYEAKIPSYITASDLMIMKKALENVRISSHTTNLHLLGLENEITERAAEYGNNDAVSLLAFEALLDDKRDVHDKKYAKKLIGGLLEFKHPLTLKLSGDLCVKNDMFDQALDFYGKFLNVEDDTFLASEVHSASGKINFQRANLVQARLDFEKAIRTGPIDKIATAHYYLGQIYSDSDVLRARYHFELSASQGFVESFQSLGFMELNLFGNPPKAQEWFMLGVELRDFDCLVGMFDCYAKRERWKDCYRVWKQLEGNLDEAKFKHFEESRKKSLELMNVNYKPIVNQMKDIATFAKEAGQSKVENNDRWSL